MQVREPGQPGLTDDQMRGLKRLREPFDAAEIGKLPRYVGPKNTPKEQRDRKRCGECNTTHDFPAVHLDYVGHAAVVNRLLEVDPEWGWEPWALDEKGLPLVTQAPDGSLALWVRLTVCGVTRPGVGTVEKNSTEPLKQLISDALRNAAQRFGVALDLWAKQDLQHDDAPSRSPQGTEAFPPIERRGTITDEQISNILQAAEAVEIDVQEVVRKRGYGSIAALSTEQGERLEQWLHAKYAEQQAQGSQA